MFLPYIDLSWFEPSPIIWCATGIIPLLCFAAFIYMSYLLSAGVSRCYFVATGTCSFAPTLQAYNCLLVLLHNTQIDKSNSLWNTFNLGKGRYTEGVPSIIILQWVPSCCFFFSLHLCLLASASPSPCHTSGHNFPRWPATNLTSFRLMWSSSWYLVHILFQGESYLCSGVAVDPSSELHVTAFTPLASRDTVT